ncbi:plant/protein (DUF668) [Rhynchospora pubera]|uniref:Plant/protein (DUF668) n=1 Tax=Rhynchospora pubera TaxID=906938 RepID=A0AAV8D031_9POAL|nr:plant/protein (DUF668) [Rhynchospora pubera]
MRTILSLDSTTTSKKKKKNHAAGGESCPIVGILSFELANALSRIASLYRSLSDSELVHLRTDPLSAHAVRLLVSPHEPYLLALILAEKLDELNRAAALASRLGRHRCTLPCLQGFEHIYSDLLSSNLMSPSSQLLKSDPVSLFRKIDRLTTSTVSLYTELESLTELEQTAKKLNQPANEEARRVLDSKIRWRRSDIRRIRDASLWNRTYDEAILILARAVCAVHSRLCQVFGEIPVVLECLFPEPKREKRRISVSDQIMRSGLLPMDSGPIRFEPVNSIDFKKDGLRLNCGASPGRLFLECLSLSTSASWKDTCEDNFEDETWFSQTKTGPLVPFSGVPFSGDSALTKSGRITSRVRFGPKTQLTMLAPPSTIGGSGLALHYANIIIIVEKLLKYPHLVGEEARDDLYQMLPSSLRLALRKSLKSYAKSMAIYDAFLAHDWKETVEKTLSWLAPMAHNMIRWQTERSIEQQQIITRGNVLLLETLYFADREKAESVICELLVGLNYICRYEQQQNALLDCSSSMDFDDCMEWQLQL